VAALLDGADGQTATKRHHRVLTERPAQRPQLVEFLREVLARHHADTAKRERIRKINEALRRQGFPPRSIFPTNPSTRKGNLAEVVLAEYLVASEALSLPVYRLRYNPNVDQSMKGDDVLAFDLDSHPMRVLVGESKFRSAPRREDVEEIVAGLLRSYKAKIPASLQFVADRLYEENRAEIARRVEECQLAIVRDQVQLDYVGLLLGSKSASNCVSNHTPEGQPNRLAMISLGVNDSDSLVDDCFRELA
jgi:hypothetical protein